MGTRHRTAVAGLLTMLLAAGLTAGCAGGTDKAAPRGSFASGEPAPTDSVSPSTPPTPAVPPPSDPGAPGAGKPTEGATMTLSGTVEDGAEHGCVLLRADGKVYQLSGGDKNILKSGNKVTVTGRPVKVMSYCMQGEPFAVTQARLS
jgi:hypothetical protein